MDKVIEIQKLNECNLLKDKFAEVEWKKKIGTFYWILKDPYDVLSL